MYTIYNEDCLEALKRIPADSIDMILCDLPYNMTDCAWDKAAIDLSAMWSEFKRTLKPCRSAVLFASGKFTHKLTASNFDWYKYKWIWVKNAPTMFIHAKNMPMRKFEEILVFSDGVVNHASVSNKRMTYNPQGVRMCVKIKSNQNKVKPSQLREGFIFHGQDLRKFGSTYSSRPSHVNCYVQEQTGYPSDVLYFDVVSSTKKVHPTQKPIALLEYLIRTYTNEGEVVLDATMGSGSTGVAAINTGRDFIGFELEKNFYDIAQKRIDEAQRSKAQELFSYGDDNGRTGESEPIITGADGFTGEMSQMV